MKDNKLNRKQIVNNINNVIAKLNVLSSSDTSAEKRDQYKACILDILSISSVIDERLEKLDLLENYFKLFGYDLDKVIDILKNDDQYLMYEKLKNSVIHETTEITEVDDKKGV